MKDEFSQRYDAYLSGQYDSPDRIVLNAYFRSGHMAGGFRNWWRALKGNDEQLDDTRLMRMGGRFGRRLRGYAKKAGIPVIDSKPSERKAELVKAYVPDDPEYVGLFGVVVSRASAPTWHIHRNEAGRIQNIVRKMSFVNHYYFHIIDPEWGHITIRMSSHPPFRAQVILNGHHYLARQAAKVGLELGQVGNSFTQVNGDTDLTQLADTVGPSDLVGPLRQVCERWLYSSCLCFGLSLAEQEQSGFRYDYSIYQVEYSRNLIFKRPQQMEQLFESLIDRSRSRLDIPRLKTIFGAKRRPYRHTGNPVPRQEVVTERPSYNLTVFKIHFGKLTLKLYAKGANVLRAEAIVHNTRALKLRRSLDSFPVIIAKLKGMVIRFLDRLQAIDQSFIADETLDTLAQPAFINHTRIAGIDLDKPRLRAVLEALVSLSLTPDGFRVSDLAAKVRDILQLDQHAYLARHAAYDLKKFRAKGWVEKIGSSRRYLPSAEGLQTMSALLILREKVIKPVLAGAAKPKPGPQPKDQSQLDLLYLAVHSAMRDLFLELGIAI